MYTYINFKTKKALKEAVKLNLEGKGPDVTIFAPGLGTPKQNGTEFLEGPHYPAAHTWYAQVEMKDGKVIKVK
jgi:hypothetical protein